MFRKQLLSFLFIFISLFAVLHILAMKFYLYWSFWWFDLLTHFLGGFWIGLAALWLFLLSGYTSYTTLEISKKSIFLISLSSVIIVGLLWEVFELFAGVPIIVIGSYALDASVDLIMNILGAAAASLFFMAKALKGSPDH